MGIARLKTEMRHKLFAKRFFELQCNAMAAYREAGFRGKTEKTVAVGAVELLANPKVQKYIAAEFDRLQARMDLAQDQVLREFMRVGYANIAWLCRWGNDYLEIFDSDDLPEDVTAAVQEVSAVTKTKRYKVNDQWVEEVETRTKVKMHDKSKALTQLQQYFTRGLALNAETDKTVTALIKLAAKFLPAEQVPQYLEAVDQYLEADDTAPAA